ncbi:hypothetical protein PRIC1_004166 [Phytophthora ramorum]|uniref:uncharacterized protein n=1 Tax=Phytophthora ramorum TaxID=164328 RepID=UPI00309A98ED|nr:hypothetical protein KRP23_3902 [Phytophthora ramorum]KAH7507760.1 hypothetical protein KRP22_2857 [Phytophthora ramorum]
MVQGDSIARVYSVMQESQQLREKNCALSEKNRQLAKALTKAKQELTKARVAQNTAFSDKVAEWMHARCKPVGVQHQATQCSFAEFEQGTCVSMENLPPEPDPPLSPQQNDGATQTCCPDSRVPSPICEDVTVEYEAAIEDNSTPSTTTNLIGQAGIHVGSESPQNSRSDPDSGRSSSQARRLRHRDAGISYVEPKLNTKLRQGDYYGLGKRTGQQSYRHRPPKHRVVSEPLRAALSGQQCRRRIMQRVQRVSYAEPKLNTKLRQGDKFTFTT